MNSWKENGIIILYNICFVIFNYLYIFRGNILKKNINLIYVEYWNISKLLLF